jgi:hypothetical protein
MYFIRFLCLFFIVIFFSNCGPQQKSIKKTTTFTPLFSDSGTKNWQENWFLDGKKAQVTNSHLGMEFSAGNEFGNDSCHAVLWTKKTFTGNFRLSYEYTRTDTVTRCVNILYFLATGKGTDEFPEDISLWNHKREVPKMKVYFNHMNTYHISYSAFDAKKFSGENDYIRLRKYNPTQLGLKNTDIGSDYYNTGLFKTNKTYKINLEKRDLFITMTITNPKNLSETLHCKWDISGVENLAKGRIGFRHMYTRSAIYKNIEVWQIE